MRILDLINDREKKNTVKRLPMGPMRNCTKLGKL